MNRISEFIKDTRTISAIGMLLMLAAIYLIHFPLHLSSLGLYLGMALVVTTWGGYWVIRWQRSRGASNAMEKMFQNQAENALKTAPASRKQDVEILRKRLLVAIKKIKTSKLGQKTGGAALYEMPWYIVIGNPSAGKSTAVLNSGLNFPFSDNGGPALQGVGGTRNCDWFFTTEGILLDTAGRYAVHEEDRSEWFGFLDLLKKHRPKAPINGIVIVASIAELTGNRPDFTIDLAKQLRQRVQELTERLELFAPVYVMFTKVDLIAGFVDFFEDSDAEERSRVWGATMPYDMDGKANAANLFDQHFDSLADGIKELGTTRMSLNRGQQMSPGILTFPMEFMGVKQHLRTFIATLFEENPFQFKPIFRGFYFTSAVQEGIAVHATGQRIVQQYGLASGRKMTASISSNTGFFLKTLFSSVIFADRSLVRQYASRKKLRLRQLSFLGGVLILGLILGCWSWSFVVNQQYVEHVQADLQNASKIQQARQDLASRLRALEILQDRLEQLQRYRTEKPLALGFGLFQGERIENKLRSEYFKGLQEVMLDPVTANIETFLTEVNANAGKMDAAVRAPQEVGITPSTASVERTKTPSSPYKALSPTNPENAYNALKTYLMLASRDRIDPSHLGDQITRFWRGWLDMNRGDASREEIIRSAEKLIGFYLSQVKEPDFPLIENKLALIDQTRETLRVAIKGTPARERVYSEIKMRASTRFPAVTVAAIVGAENKDIITGSRAIPGAFTRDAWEKYVKNAIKDASTKELQSTDWVLQTTVHNDLSLEGSPEQIQKELTHMYKAEYANEWKAFMQGITIADFETFDRAVADMDRLGDPRSSPMKSLIQALYNETSWDNPSLAVQGFQHAQRNLVDWFREVILRQSPSLIGTNIPQNTGRPDEPNMGTIGRQFAAIARLAIARDVRKDASLLNGYLDHLSKLRTRFNQIKNSGDVGPASQQLMQATLDGSNSELADALKFVDENMLTGMQDAERATIRPLLVRPLMQAFSVIIAPSEQELNRTWAAQVFEPFGKSLATKYPFSANARIEAMPGEIAQVFGPEGSIAKFVQTSMGPLVVRRGDTMSARTWADMGIHLNPVFAENLARFVAPPGGAASSSRSDASQPQTNFQLQPIPTPGLIEYTIEIDGQIMRYRNGRQDWSSFSWPSSKGEPGAKITAVTADGRALEIVNFPGQFGLEKLINSAQRTKLENGVFSMIWSNDDRKVSVNFRLISDARSSNSMQTNGGGDGLRGLTLPATVAGAVS